MSSAERHSGKAVNRKSYPYDGVILLSDSFLIRECLKGLIVRHHHIVQITMGYLGV